MHIETIISTTKSNVYYCYSVYMLKKGNIKRRNRSERKTTKKT